MTTLKWRLNSLLPLILFLTESWLNGEDVNHLFLPQKCVLVVLYFGNVSFHSQAKRIPSSPNGKPTYLVSEVAYLLNCLFICSFVYKTSLYSCQTHTQWLFILTLVPVDVGLISSTIFSFHFLQYKWRRKVFHYILNIFKENIADHYIA